MSDSRSYRDNIGSKFFQDGSVRYYPGNTIISFIQRQSPVFDELVKIRSDLQMCSAGSCFTFLPDSSLHMTVFEGVCFDVRVPELWSRFLPLDASMDEADSFIEARFSEVPSITDVCMRTDGIVTGFGYGVSLVPDSPEDLLCIRDYRDALSESTGIRFPNHEEYRFHISLCYGISDPDEKQNRVLDQFERDAVAYIKEHPVKFKIDQPRMTFFRDMFAFETVRFQRT